MTIMTAEMILTLRVVWLLYKPSGLTSHNSRFCTHSVFMCSVWISEQTEIISLYRINCFYNRERVCLLRGTKWVFKYNSGQSQFSNA